MIRKRIKYLADLIAALRHAQHEEDRFRQLKLETCPAAADKAFYAQQSAAREAAKAGKPQQPARSLAELHGDFDTRNRVTHAAWKEVRKARFALVCEAAQKFCDAALALADHAEKDAREHFARFGCDYQRPVTVRTLRSVPHWLLSIIANENTAPVNALPWLAQEITS